MSDPGVVVVSFIGGDMETQGGTCQVHSLKVGKGANLGFQSGLWAPVSASSFYTSGCLLFVPLGQSVNSQ